MSDDERISRLEPIEIGPDSTNDSTKCRYRGSCQLNPWRLGSQRNVLPIRGPGKSLRSGAVALTALRTYFSLVVDSFSFRVLINRSMASDGSVCSPIRKASRSAQLI